MPEPVEGVDALLPAPPEDPLPGDPAADGALVPLPAPAVLDPVAGAADSDLPPVPPDAVSAGAAVVAGAPVPAAVSLALAAPLLLLRKSVTYQPEPLSWNPAAVTCLE